MSFFSRLLASPSMSVRTCFAPLRETFRFLLLCSLRPLRLILLFRIVFGCGFATLGSLRFPVCEILVGLPRSGLTGLVARSGWPGLAIILFNFVQYWTETPPDSGYHSMRRLVPGRLKHGLIRSTLYARTMTPLQSSPGHPRQPAAVISRPRDCVCWKTAYV
jgi:hypothetical protein